MNMGYGYLTKRFIYKIIKPKSIDVDLTYPFSWIVDINIIIFLNMEQFYNQKVK